MSGGLSCPTCRASLEANLPLCVACGHLVPERADEPRGCLVRRLPEERTARDDLERLLAAATGQDRASVARYCQQGGALFVLPASALIATQLLERLAALGAEVALEEPVRLSSTAGAWLRTLWQDKVGLVALSGAGGLAVFATARGSAAAWLWFLVSGAIAVLDARRFRKRISLSPAVLARRLGVVPEALARPASALLRRARPGALREGLAAVITEQARLLAAVSRALAAHPALQAPFRDTLDEVGQHTLVIAEHALAVEEASGTEDAHLPQRLADLRALGSAETDRQLQALVTSRNERRARQEWLQRAHALLLIRLEAIAGRLRGLRQEVAQRVVELGAAHPPDDLLTGLGRELELAVSALHEVERPLPDALPEVIAQVVAARP